MKKLYVNSVSILFAVLCLVFTACNGMTAGKGTGTVRVVIGGGGNPFRRFRQRFAGF